VVSRFKEGTDARRLKQCLRGWMAWVRAVRSAYWRLGFPCGFAEQHLLRNVVHSVLSVVSEGDTPPISPSISQRSLGAGQSPHRYFSPVKTPSPLRSSSYPVLDILTGSRGIDSLGLWAMAAAMQRGSEVSPKRHEGRMSQEESHQSRGLFCFGSAFGSSDSLSGILTAVASLRGDQDRARPRNSEQRLATAISKLSCQCLGPEPCFNGIRRGALQATAECLAQKLGVYRRKCAAVRIWRSWIRD
jgi:hypothetical protein